MEELIAQLVHWIETSDLNMRLSLVLWFVPFVQAVHILSVSVVMSCAVFVDLRVLGILAARQSLPNFLDRFLAPLWWTLLVLLATGVSLIVVEPARELQNWTFRFKMLLILVAIALTWLVIRPLSLRDKVGQSPPVRSITKVVALVSLALWAAIVIAGRMIAYDPVVIGVS